MEPQNEWNPNSEQLPNSWLINNLHTSEGDPREPDQKKSETKEIPSLEGWNYTGSDLYEFDTFLTKDIPQLAESWSQTGLKGEGTDPKASRSKETTGVNSIHAQILSNHQVCRYREDLYRAKLQRQSWDKVPIHISSYVSKETEFVIWIQASWLPPRSKILKNTYIKSELLQYDCNS